MKKPPQQVAFDGAVLGQDYETPEGFPRMKTRPKVEADGGFGDPAPALVRRLYYVRR